MKFELEPYHRNIPNESLLKDLKRVARILKKDSVTIEEYDKSGSYHSSTLRNRFKSWPKALILAGLSKTRNLNIPTHELLADLIRVAEKIGKQTLTQDEYRNNGLYGPSTVAKRFNNSWLTALKKAGLRPTRYYKVSDEDYFRNLEKVWRSLGRQPKYSEMQTHLSKYSSGAYENRFGTWRKALKAFIEFVNQEQIGDSRIYDKESKESSPIDEGQPKDTVPQYYKLRRERRSRLISWRLRFLVMRRDHFRCCHCGRSPASTRGVVLQIDHKRPWSKNGPTEMDNLQTLCQECNIGKSNLPLNTKNEG